MTDRLIGRNYRPMPVPLSPSLSQACPDMDSARTYNRRKRSRGSLAQNWPGDWYGLVLVPRRGPAYAERHPWSRAAD